MGLKEHCQLRAVLQGSRIKSDQNGIESVYVHFMFKLREIMIKSDQNGIERSFEEVSKNRSVLDKIRPKWD